MRSVIFCYLLACLVALAQVAHSTGGAIVRRQPERNTTDNSQRSIRAFNGSNLHPPSGAGAPGGAHLPAMGAVFGGTPVSGFGAPIPVSGFFGYPGAYPGVLPIPAGVDPGPQNATRGGEASGEGRRGWGGRGWGGRGWGGRGWGWGGRGWGWGGGFGGVQPIFVPVPVVG